MITIEKTTGNLVEIKVPEKLEPGDFKALSPAIDNLIREQGQIRILLDARDFNGWRNTEAAEEHFRFVKAHEQYVARAALLAGHSWQHWIGAFANIFLEPEVKVFDGEADAREWLLR